MKHKTEIKPGRQSHGASAPFDVIACAHPLPHQLPLSVIFQLSPLPANGTLRDEIIVISRTPSPEPEHENRNRLKKTRW